MKLKVMLKIEYNSRSVFYKPIEFIYARAWCNILKRFQCLNSNAMNYTSSNGLLECQT